MTERPSLVSVSWNDLEGRIHSAEFTGLLAQIWCHEVDHLDGVLMLDRCDPATVRTVQNLGGVCIYVGGISSAARSQEHRERIATRHPGADTACMNLIDMIAYVSASIGGSFGLLQTERTMRTRTTDGVSKLSWATMGTNAGFWIAYGLHTDSTQQLVGNTPWLVMTLVVGWFLAKEHRLSLSVGLGWPVSMLLLGVAVMSVNTAVLGPLSVGLSLLVTIPQLLAAQRSEHAVGVSVWAWVASSTAGIGWIVYGVASNDVPVLIASIPGFALNTAVTVVVMMRHRRAVANGPQPDPA